MRPCLHVLQLALLLVGCAPRSLPTDRSTQVQAVPTPDAGPLSLSSVDSESGLKLEVTTDKPPTPGAVVRLSIAATPSFDMTDSFYISPRIYSEVAILEADPPVGPPALAGQPVHYGLTVRVPSDNLQRSVRIKAAGSTGNEGAVASTNLLLNPTGLPYGYAGCMAMMACEAPAELRLIPDGPLTPGKDVGFELLVDRTAIAPVKLKIATAGVTPASSHESGPIIAAERRSRLRATIHVPPVRPPGFAVVGTAELLETDGTPIRTVTVRIGGVE